MGADTGFLPLDVGGKRKEEDTDVWREMGGEGEGGWDFECFPPMMVNGVEAGEAEGKSKTPASWSSLSMSSLIAISSGRVQQVSL